MKAVINVGATGHGKDNEVRIDGFNVTNAISGFTLSSSVHEVTTLELDVLLLQGAAVTADARVHIPEAAAELLKLLGWTPPVAPPALPDAGATALSVASPIDDGPSADIGSPPS